jgi:hypothetical protein
MEEDKEDKEQTNKNCVICCYSKTSTFNLIHYELNRNYILCEICNNIFHVNFKNALLDMAKELNIQINMNLSETQWKKIFNVIVKKYNDSTEILTKISILMDKVFSDTYKEIQYRKPFNQCIIYNYKGEFLGYTTHKHMKHALKLKKAIQISDNEMRWNFPVIKNTDDKYYFNYSRNKENKCIKCNNDEFLDTFTILPKDKIKEFEGEGINIHFYYALCSKCKEKCLSVKEYCNSTYIKKNGKNICQDINDLIENKNKEKLNQLIIDYNEFYKKELELI